MRYLKKSWLKPAWIFIFLLAVAGCQKEGDPSPEPIDPSMVDCRISSESSDLAADINTLNYEYDAAGFLTAITKRNVSNQEIHTVSFGSNFVLRTDTDGEWLRYDYSSDIRTNTVAVPAQSELTIYGAGGTEADHMVFKYSYDSRQRIVKISETSPDFAGDYEYDIDISYNNVDNVTAIRFTFTSGPPIAPLITVTGNDDKPTPYLKIPNYRFFMNKFHWNNPDPEPLITALSRNNPTGFTINPGFGSATTRTMTHEYNEKGFPTKRTNQETTGSIQKSWTQSFTFSCE